jgi:hypothetical protein
MRALRPARELRNAIDAMPLETRRAMLDALDRNPIIVGAYTAPGGGVCPMLAAHRNGGRTSLASFARAWDRYTNARGRPRPATEHELTTLTAMLQASVALDELPTFEDAAREAKKRVLNRLRIFRRFDEYERAVAELGVIRALNRPDGRTAAPAPRNYARS